MSWFEYFFGGWWETSASATHREIVALRNELVPAFKLAAMGTDISASEVCKSSGRNPQKYQELLTALNVSVKECVVQNVKSKKKYYSYKWAPKEKETAAYPNLCAYLKDEYEIMTAIVDNGQCCVAGRLYNQEVYTLRPYVGAHSADLTAAQRLVLKFNLFGRPDIIGIRRQSTTYTRALVTFAVELKRPGDMNPSAVKEAIIHLIGVNIANSVSSPPLLLTDLVDCNKVMFIEMETNLDILCYTIRTYQFPTLTHAVDYIKNNLLTKSGFREGCTGDFGRGPSPMSSIDHTGFAVPGSFANFEEAGDSDDD